MSACATGPANLPESGPQTIPEPAEPATLPQDEPAIPPLFSDPPWERAAQAAAARPAEADGPPGTAVLLLPSQNTPFARAAEVVRQGFFAARAADVRPMTVRLVEIDDDGADLLRALATARERGVDVAVGPLLRSQANAVLKANVAVPTVTLTLPDNDALASPALLAFGLSVEEEARAMVRAVLDTLMPLPPGALTRPTPRFMLLVGEAPLSKRAGLAFRDALRQAGERVTVLDVELKYDALQALGDRVFRAEPDGVFLALDAREAAIVRPRLPHDLVLFGTSQVNLGGGESALLSNDLDGVRFVDVPWLLERDHPAVMIYSRPEQAMSAELNRLYALGIDAYRLASAWRSGQTRFMLDGVTGALRVDRAISATVERWPAFAVFRNGRIERLDVPRRGAPY